MIRQPPRSTRTDTLLSLHDALPIFGAVQLDAGTSQKAGTGALIQAFRSADSGRTLVAASEKRRARPASEDELANRSEEHTSELQSLMRISYAVFCLKKKKQHIDTHNLITLYHNTSIIKILTH